MPGLPSAIAAAVFTTDQSVEVLSRVTQEKVPLDCVCEGLPRFVDSTIRAGGVSAGIVQPEIEVKLLSQLIFQFLFYSGMRSAFQAPVLKIMGYLRKLADAVLAYKAQNPTANLEALAFYGVPYKDLQSCWSTEELTPVEKLPEEYLNMWRANRQLLVNLENGVGRHAIHMSLLRNGANGAGLVYVPSLMLLNLLFVVDHSERVRSERSLVLAQWRQPPFAAGAVAEALSAELKRRLVGFSWEAGQTVHGSPVHQVESFAHDLTHAMHSYRLFSEFPDPMQQLVQFYKTQLVGHRSFQALSEARKEELEDFCLDGYPLVFMLRQPGFENFNITLDGIIGMMKERIESEPLSGAERRSYLAVLDAISQHMRAMPAPRMSAS